LVAGAAFVADAISRGAYLITPGWLEDWRGKLGRMGFDEGSASGFFRDSAREFLLLDTGVAADAPGKLAELAGAVGLPASRVVVGIDYVRQQLGRLVAEWRLEEAQRQALKSGRDHACELADHKAAMDFLGRLPLLKDEQETIAVIAEMFHMLFAPQEFHYVRYENGVALCDDTLPPDLSGQVRKMKGDWAWTGSNTGFLLRIAKAGELLGVVVVDRFAFPKHRNRYLNLALAIAGVAGLAIDNARTYRRMKEADAALQALNETLEQRVQQGITQNMTQERLLIQQSRLAAMGEMIGNIAHQWRQPINALALLLANIKDANDYHELDTAMIDESTKKGQELIQKMSTTIDDFRNFFKPNREKQSFQPWDGIEDAIKLVNESFKLNGIEIELDKSGEPCEVMGYPNEFSQVVLNALSNAKEAIIDKEMHGKVHIQVEKGTDSAAISIRNNGGCIPEDIMPKIFDPYFTTKEKGTGIGLYMSQMIMGHMDGDITICNVEDGVEVRLTLPQASGHAA